MVYVNLVDEEPALIDGDHIGYFFLGDRWDVCIYLGHDVIYLSNPKQFLKFQILEWKCILIRF